MIRLVPYSTLKTEYTWENSIVTLAGSLRHSCPVLLVSSLPALLTDLDGLMQWRSSGSQFNAKYPVDVYRARIAVLQTGTRTTIFKYLPLTADPLTRLRVNSFPLCVTDLTPSAGASFECLVPWIIDVLKLFPLPLSGDVNFGPVWPADLFKFSGHLVSSV